MTQIAVRDDLVEKAMRLTEGKYPLEQLAEFAFRGYTDVLSIKELEGKFHWDDTEDWSEDDEDAPRLLRIRLAHPSSRAPCSVAATDEPQVVKLEFDK